jgi:hypothetical protein
MADLLPPDTRDALEHLIRVATQDKVIVAGFAFSVGDAFFLLNFGNCTDHGDVRLYEELCRMKDEGVRTNKIVVLPVGKIN